MNRSIVILVALSMVLNVLAGAILSIYNENCILFDCSDIKATNYYMTIDRLSSMLFALAFYLYSKTHKTLSILVFILFVYAFSEATDELFFDPTRLQLNEILIFLFSLIYLKRLWFKTTPKT